MVSLKHMAEFRRSSPEGMMLKTLTISNFTAFSKASFSFSPGLNVIVGTNGTGKTHVLKLGYMFTRAWPDFAQKRLSLVEKRAESYFEEKLMGLFRPERLSRVLRTGEKGRSMLAAEVVGWIPTIVFHMRDEPPPPREPVLQESLSWQIALDHEQADEVAIRVTDLPKHKAQNTILPFPLFVPSKEIVSFFDGLIALFENYKIQLDETYRDLAVAMTVPESQRPSELLPTLLDALSRAVGGELVLEKGKLLLAQTDGTRLEPQLMAEGFRKLGMLLYLVRRNVIQAGTTVFWDEPEANLNPDLTRPLIEVLVGLAAHGVQIVLATHSLFVLREVEILLRDDRYKVIPRTFFALAPSKQGVKVSQGASFEDIDPILSLEADLAQSGRFMDVMD
jgi:ABC-type phosphonate transport system ATPase subunit